jgi:polar amino acid transport system substrate-binding protein
MGGREGVRRIAGWRTAAFGAALVATAFSVAACSSAPSPKAQVLTPKVKPPVIAKAGVLHVAVDSSYPPFAAKQDGTIVGIDADVAAALAQELGLKLVLVDVKPDALALALRHHTVDVGLGAIPITQASLSNVTIASSYLIDGPALFAKDTSLTAAGISGVPVAVQKGSQAYWALMARPGAKLVAVTSLRDAFKALSNGSAQAVAGDALVAGYIRRDFPGVGFVGQLGEATPLGVSVAADAKQLGAAVSDALDKLAGTGVIDAIRSKWEGDLPALTVSGSPEASSAIATTGTAASGVSTP